MAYIPLKSFFHYHRIETAPKKGQRDREGVPRRYAGEAGKKRSKFKIKRYGQRKKQPGKLICKKGV